MKVYFAFEIFSILLFLLLDFSSRIFYLGVFVWEVCNRDSDLFIYGHFYGTLISYPNAEQNPKIIWSVFFLLVPYYIEKGQFV